MYVIAPKESRDYKPVYNKLKLLVETSSLEDLLSIQKILKETI